MLLALATVSVATSSTGVAFKILWLFSAYPGSLVKGKRSIFLFFWGPSLIAMQDFYNGTVKWTQLN